ncbi:hypothetical protein BGZ83_008545 [Gryganskiella cystojenkinii]|nr:hypothetical protein BGZ83_008545 [Gryganskiella cystojenkinii]
MDSTGRTRTLSESEVQVPDRNLPVSVKHQQHPLRNHTTTGEQISQDKRLHRSHSTSRPDEDQSEDITTEDIRHIHISSSQQQQHRLSHDSRSQSRRRKDNSSGSTPFTLHKRQRSPTVQMSPFDSSAPSSTSSVSNMERSKRARHLPSGTTQPEELPSSMETQVESMGLNHDREWQEIIEPHDHVSGTARRQSLVSTQKAMSRDSSNQNVQVHAHHTLATQRQDSSRVHPLDNDITHSRMSATSVVRSESESPVHPHDIPPKASLRIENPPALSVDTTIVKSHVREIEVVCAPSSHPPPTARIESKGPQKKEQTQPAHQQQQRHHQHQLRPEKPVQASGVKSTTTSSASSSALSSPVPVTLSLPITRDTLRELDLFEIFKNPQLRHDIVFDPHLQFRPNFDGERGLMKRREADRFWREVGLELNNRRVILAARRETTATLHSLAGLSSSSSSSRMIQQQAQQMCPLPKAVLLPRLVDELREILLSLLPAPAAQPGPDGTIPVNPERALLISTLDPELLIQELDHGVLDVYALFRFLGDSLKGHCAPMRDTLVESMVTIVVDSDEIVRGIRMCFEILEWMKLDIANHQLRTLRPWLLDNSIDFEQKYFTEHLARGGTIQRTRDWFKRSWTQWEGVKQLVIGNTTTTPVLPSPSTLLRRPSTVFPSQSGSDGEGSDSSMSPPPLTFNAKRRTSVVSAEIGENILDGVVNEGLLEMIMRPHGSVNTMPETFELDHYRLLSFHNDFQDLTILCTLLILFRQLAQNCWTLQDLVEIKKVVWLLLTDENANFGSNTNNNNNNTSVGGGTSQQQGKGPSSPSSGMKDIVIQIEFAARKVRERSMNAAATAAASTSIVGSRRSSLAPDSPLPTGPLRRASAQTSPILSLPPAGIAAPWNLKTGSSMKLSISHPIGAAAVSSPVATTPAAISAMPGLSARETNLLTAWLDNALCRTSTLYRLIQKRLLIHFRRWLYLHSCSSMLVLSASCASLTSAMSMSYTTTAAGAEIGKADLDEDDENSKGTVTTSPASASNISTAQSSTSSQQSSIGAPLASGTAPPTPEPTAEEANKAAAEALAAKMSFNATEMEAHGLTGLEDEMTVLLEKVRAVSEFNKKVYGSWYRDMVKQGKAESWLEVS